MTTHIAQFPQPTASFLVPIISALGEEPFRILTVQFRTKRDGGVGVPGERLDVTKEDISTAAARGVGEELGVVVPASSFKLFAVRDAPGRDVRNNVNLQKLVHGRPLPPELAAIPAGVISTFHGPDTVLYCSPLDLSVLGVTVPLWDDPQLAPDVAILKPGDPEEVLRVVAIDTRSKLPKLPISDDAKLLIAWRNFVAGGMQQIPGLLR